MSISVERFAVTIPTERLVLRKIEENDGVALFEGYASDDRATRYLSWPTNTKPSETIGYARLAIRLWDEGSQFTYSLVERSENRVVGSVSVRRFRSELPFHLELGYCISKSYWGRGLASEAARALIDHAFSLPAIYRISAFVHPENGASLRVLEKLGLEREVLLKRAAIYPQLGSEPVDVYLYGMVR